MSEKIVQLNEEVIKGQIKELVRGSVEEPLNELLEKEAESLTQAARYERSEARQGYRSGHYDRNLTTTSGDVTLHMPRLKGVSFETAIIERYRRREIRRRTRVVGTFPDGNPALMLVCAWLRHVGGHPVGQQEIHEHETLGGGSGRRPHCRLTSFSRSLQTNLRINLDGTKIFSSF